MVDHDAIRAKLGGYLDDTLGGEDRDEVKRHLKSCGACRSMIADLELTVRKLKLLPSVEPPYWFTSRIMERAETERMQRPAPRRRVFTPVRLALALAIVLLLVLAAAYRFLRNSGSPPETAVAPQIPSSTAVGAPRPSPQQKTSAPVTGSPEIPSFRIRSQAGTTTPAGATPAAALPPRESGEKAVVELPQPVPAPSPRPASPKAPPDLSLPTGGFGAGDKQLQPFGAEAKGGNP